MSKIMRALWHNGPMRTWKQLHYMADTKIGTLVGVDKFGNKYYENLKEDFGRERWIEFGNEKGADASQVPPEWHMWLHAINDANPTNTKLVRRHWEAEYTDNLTATDKAYVPYNTTVSKVEPWTPKVAQRG
eukprot:Unigene6040_Nuclearia_a/m.18514 Unigene6040_Nuclearia_a/g.18514  ORF Unigene6040_Nuclearia_a/g.18514 Unigene6040_Nuclearia_a/m.18514 type:complete len:131 (-) Unigene6040_Nuclearia_a:193-585(-)